MTIISIDLLLRYLQPGHRVPRWSTINFGICVPSSCTSEDIEIALKHYTEAFTNGTGFLLKVRVESEMCYVKDDKWMSNLDLGTTIAVWVYTYKRFVAYITVVNDIFFTDFYAYHCCWLLSHQLSIIMRELESQPVSLLFICVFYYLEKNYRNIFLTHMLHRWLKHRESQILLKYFLRWLCGIIFFDKERIEAFLAGAWLEWHQDSTWYSIF